MTVLLNETPAGLDSSKWSTLEKWEIRRRPRNLEAQNGGKTPEALADPEGYDRPERRAAAEKYLRDQSNAPKDHPVTHHPGGLSTIEFKGTRGTYQR
jgi:hypothetical protein